MSKETASQPGLISSIVSNKCPHCRKGDLFINPNPYNLKTTMKMPEHCPVCGQKYDLQTGFYFGTGFVSYAMTVFISAVTFVLWWFTIGMGIKDNRVLYWLASNAGLLVVLQPVIQRLSRSIWISLFVRYNANWKNEGLVA
jgi:uncharacterized protein (DUF983 family)